MKTTNRFSSVLGVLLFLPLSCGSFRHLEKQDYEGSLQDTPPLSPEPSSLISTQASVIEPAKIQNTLPVAQVEIKPTAQPSLPEPMIPVPPGTEVDPFGRTYCHGEPAVCREGWKPGALPRTYQDQYSGLIWHEYASGEMSFYDTSFQEWKLQGSLIGKKYENKTLVISNTRKNTLTFEYDPIGKTCIRSANQEKDGLRDLYFSESGNFLEKSTDLVTILVKTKRINYEQKQFFYTTKANHSLEDFGCHVNFDNQNIPFTLQITHLPAPFVSREKNLEASDFFENIPEPYFYQNLKLGWRYIQNYSGTTYSILRKIQNPKVTASRYQFVLAQNKEAIDQNASTDDCENIFKIASRSASETYLRSLCTRDIEGFTFILATDRMNAIEKELNDLTSQSNMNQNFAIAQLGLAMAVGVFLAPSVAEFLVQPLSSAISWGSVPGTRFYNVQVLKTAVRGAVIATSAALTYFSSNFLWARQARNLDQKYSTLAQSQRMLFNAMKAQLKEMQKQDTTEEKTLDRIKKESNTFLGLQANTSTKDRNSGYFHILSRYFN